MLCKEEHVSLRTQTWHVLSVSPLPLAHGMVTSVDVLCSDSGAGWVLLSYPVLHVSHSDVPMVSHCLAHTVYLVTAPLADEGELQGSPECLEFT